MKAILTLFEGCQIKIVDSDGVGYMVIIYPTTDKIIIPLEDLEILMAAYAQHITPEEGERLH
jgi:hypothetical protein